MKPSLCNVSTCAYCNACTSVCKHHAISFVYDIYGYASVVIDWSKCVECGLCEKVCPVKNAPYGMSLPVATYALYSKNKKTVAQSSSGGVFLELAQHTIDQGGCVFGVISHNGRFEFACANTYSELEPMCGSKYVQAEMGEILIVAQQELRKGRKVLFTGTPCQIAALRNFLRRDYNDLLTTLEVICHGVPPKKVFDRCMDMIGIDHQSYEQAAYRDKRIWNFITRIKQSGVGGWRTIFWQNDIYMKLFMRTLTYKPVCYTCPFAKLPRIADITMGDFWGIQSSPTFKKNQFGTSVLLINSEVGQKLWEYVSARFVYEERPLDEATRLNHNILQPTPCPSNRDAVLADLFVLNKRDFIHKYGLQITLRNIVGYLLRSIKKIYAPR